LTIESLQAECLKILFLGMIEMRLLSFNCQPA
jgi:hypothetical protein